MTGNSTYLAEASAPREAGAVRALHESSGRNTLSGAIGGPDANVAVALWRVISYCSKVRFHGSRESLDNGRRRNIRLRDRCVLTLHDDAEDNALVNADLGRLSDGDVDPTNIVGGATGRTHGVLVGLEEGVEGANPGVHGREILPRTRVVLGSRLNANLVGSVLGQELDGPAGEVCRDSCGERERDGGQEAQHGDLGEHCDGLNELL